VDGLCVEHVEEGVVGAGVGEVEGLGFRHVDGDAAEVRSSADELQLGLAELGLAGELGALAAGDHQGKGAGQRGQVGAVPHDLAVDVFEGTGII